MNNPAVIRWNDVSKVGYPTAELRVRQETGAQRKFLVRNDYDIECAFAFEDGGGFDVSEQFHGEVVAWAVIEGF